MDQEKKARRGELDLDAEAFAALEEACAMPPGPERIKAKKKSGQSSQCNRPAWDRFCEAGPAHENLASGGFRIRGGRFIATDILLD
jgi:hypothetical protein